MSSRIRKDVSAAPVVQPLPLSPDLEEDFRSLINRFDRYRPSEIWPNWEERAIDGFLQLVMAAATAYCRNTAANRWLTADPDQWAQRFASAVLRITLSPGSKNEGWLNSLVTHPSVAENLVPNIRKALIAQQTMAPLMVWPPTETPEEFVEKVRTRLAEKKDIRPLMRSRVTLSQTEFALRLGVSKTTMNRIFKHGGEQVDGSVLEKFLAAIPADLNPLQKATSASPLESAGTFKHRSEL